MSAERVSSSKEFIPAKRKPGLPAALSSSGGPPSPLGNRQAPLLLRNRERGDARSNRAGGPPMPEHLRRKQFFPFDTNLQAAKDEAGENQVALGMLAFPLVEFEYLFVHKETLQILTEKTPQPENNPLDIFRDPREDSKPYQPQLKGGLKIYEETECKHVRFESPRSHDPIQESPGRRLDPSDEEILVDFRRNKTLVEAGVKAPRDGSPHQQRDSVSLEIGVKRTGGDSIDRAGPTKSSSSLDLFKRIGRGSNEPSSDGEMNDETDDFFMAAKTRPSMDILPLQIQKKIISSSPEDSNSPEIGSLEGSFDAVSLGSVKPRRPHHPLALNRGFSGQFNLELGKLAMNNPAPAPEQAQQMSEGALFKNIFTFTPPRASVPLPPMMVSVDPRIKRYLFTLVDLAGVTIPSQIGLSLHNIKTGKKITEEFLCTWNLVDFLAHDGMPPPESILSCIFPVLKVEDVFLIARCMNFSFDLEPKTSDKKLRKVSSSSTLSGPVALWKKDLRMFNLWGYIPLQGDNNNKINLYKVPKGTTIAFEDMYQQISEELAKAQNQGSSIVGSLINWDTKKVPDGVITFNMEKVINYNKLPNTIINPSQKVIKQGVKTFFSTTQELQDFSESATIFTSFVHNLYIQPLKIRGSKYRSALQLHIQVKDSDFLDNGDGGLEIIHGQPLKSKLSRYGKTAIVQNRPYVFVDEIKATLPVTTTMNHHILFTLTTVDIKKGGNVSIIGYAIYPLSGPRLQIPDENEILSLPIYPDISEHYLSTLKRDGEWPRLLFKLSLVSSVPQEKNMCTFFDTRASTGTSKGARDFYETMRGETASISNLTTIPKKLRLAFFPILFPQLLIIICKSESERRKEAFLAMFHLISAVYDEAPGKGDVLRGYANYWIDNVKNCDGIKHHQVYDGITTNFIEILQDPHHGSLENFSNFHWFWLLVIPRSMAIEITEEKKIDLPRNKRFSTEFVDKLCVLNELLSKEFFNEKIRTTDVHILANFLTSLLCLIDRGIVISLIQTFLSIVNKPAQHQLRMNFLEHIARSEQFIALNIPTPLKFSWEGLTITEMSQKMNQKYLLTAFILREVEFALSPQSGLPHLACVQTINTFRKILSRHENDKRYSSPEQQAMISSLYFQFLLFVIEDSAAISNLQTASQTRDECLCCFLYIINGIPDEVFRGWIALETKRRQAELIKILMECITTYLGDSTSIFTPGSGAMSPGKARRHPVVSNHIQKICVKVLSNFITATAKHLNEESSDSLFSIVQLLVGALTFMFQSASCSPALLFEPTTLLIKGAPQPLFPSEKTENNFLETLLTDLMRCSNSEEAEVRNGASQVLFDLLVGDFQHSGHCGGSKVSATVAISKIVGTSQTAYNRLGESLEAINELATKHETFPTTGKQQIKDIATSIQSLIQQNESIKENRNDPEMTVALYHQISKEYSSSSKLQRTWLQNLSELHADHGAFCEAAQSKIHEAVLIMAYLKKVNLLPKFPPYFEQTFNQLSPNIDLANLAVKDLQVSKSNALTVVQLIEALKLAIHHFEAATFYELGLEAYNILTILFQSVRQFSDLSQNLEKYQALVDKINNVENPLPRLIPTYFRVGFYGPAWGNMSGSVFVYRQTPSFTVGYDLPAMKSKLERQFGSKYGPEKIVIILKDEKVDESTLQADKMYIQVTGVFPFYDADKAASAIGFCDQHFGINKFVKESGISGEVKEDFRTQQKKKTVYVTEFPFPYIETRVKVIDSSEIILSPIQNSIETITTQTSKVQGVCVRPPRINPLQQALQGSVVPMVNPGPLKICEIFLSPNEMVNYPKKEVELLIQAMEDFTRACEIAVKFNREVMEEKHAKFTDMIEKNFKDLKQQIESYTRNARANLI